ncbi:MAG: ATP12 family chaperone protein [Bacteroidota bacterium]
MSENGRASAKAPAREPERPLPKRIYQAVAVAPGEAGFRVLLDRRPARTPRRRELVLPTRALADAIAAEWEAQGDRVDPATMLLTRLANTVLDGVVGREADLRADILKYAGSDLLCYRAGEPEALIALQSRHWDPVLDWGREVLGARFMLVQGLMPVSQARETLDRIAVAIADLDAFRLAALHVMTTLMGSALLGLAVVKGRLSADAAWDAAHVDEDWQISKWGEDAEAVARRRRRRAEMDAACRLLSLVSAA